MRETERESESKGERESKRTRDVERERKRGRGEKERERDREKDRERINTYTFRQQHKVSREFSLAFLRVYAVKSSRRCQVFFCDFNNFVISCDSNVLLLNSSCQFTMEKLFFKLKQIFHVYGK